ncbi:hypothetical protein Dimus_006088 [Dionaea muscipula]
MCRNELSLDGGKVSFAEMMTDDVRTSREEANMLYYHHGGAEAKTAGPEGDIGVCESTASEQLEAVSAVFVVDGDRRIPGIQENRTRFRSIPCCGLSIPVFEAPRSPFSDDLFHRRRLQRRAYDEELTEATVRRWCGVVLPDGERGSGRRDRRKRETEI